MADTEYMPPGRYGVNDAIESLRPGAMYQLSNTTFTKWWHHSNPPTWPELLDEMERLKKIAYQGCRREEYPSLSEFADAYYWKQMGDPEPMLDYLAKIKEVKEKYPKPTQE
jgi:hypothetical protein